jgi:hypothetical protein
MRLTHRVGLTLLILGGALGWILLAGILPIGDLGSVELLVLLGMVMSALAVIWFWPPDRS